MNTINIPDHGFGPIIDQSCKILILGSFPSVKSREEAFFYMYPQNRFWPLMSKILEEDFVSADIKKKREILLKYHIALYDVIESCSIEGSKDSSITDVIPTDISKLIKDTNILHIFLNGKTAFNLFLQYNPSLEKIASYLPSTSSANASYNLNRLLEIWDKIRKYL